jgi:hypothetical protein
LAGPIVLVLVLVVVLEPRSPQTGAPKPTTEYEDEDRSALCLAEDEYDWHAARHRNYFYPKHCQLWPKIPNRLPQH